MSKLDAFIDANKGKVSDSCECPISENEEHNILSKDFEVAKEIEHLLEIKNKIADIKLKQIYGYCILVILSFWILAVVFICVTYLFQDNPNISDSVLITLLTTTTANIIVLPTIVLKYLFPDNKIF